MKYGTLGNKVSDIDDRLSCIRPPNEIQRTPRSMSLTVKFWKGSYCNFMNKF